ncbi:hypothetical protein GCM10010449_85040 [Streptomyces rectiviolaceus]|uniref:Uncharacterized protein n=1 Tax=Streptomyces rectiviolaceus TaxID=332591 RepID=A0ABP6NVG4_9ACTN
MTKNGSSGAKARARSRQQRAATTYTAARRGGHPAQDPPRIQLRLDWEERDGEWWTTYQGRHYALIVHGDWHSPDHGGRNGRDIWYLHEMHANGNIRHEDQNGDQIEGWWIAGANRIRNLKRHPDLMRVAELHIDRWHWSGVYPDGTRAMSRTTWEQRRPLADLLTSTTLGPWPIPDGVCGSITHPLDPDDYLPCPHPRGHDFPCNDDPNFDAAAWRQRVDAEQAAEEARRAALTPEQRDEEDEQARQWEYEEMRAEQASEYVDDKYYGDED